MALLTPETKGFETGIESRLDGYGILDGKLAPADDAAFPQEAVSDVPAQEGRQTKDYFSIQLGLFAEGVRIDEEARRQITCEYSNVLSYSAIAYYREQAEQMPQNAAYLNCLDFLCRELEARKREALAIKADEVRERPQQSLFMLGAKRYRESMVLERLYGEEALPEDHISVLVRDMSLTGTLKLYQQVARHRHQITEDTDGTHPESKTQESNKRQGLRLTAKTLMHNFVKIAS